MKKLLEYASLTTSVLFNFRRPLQLSCPVMYVALVLVRFAFNLVSYWFSMSIEEQLVCI